MRQAAVARDALAGLIKYATAKRAGKGLRGLKALQNLELHDVCSEFVEIMALQNQSVQPPTSPSLDPFIADACKSNFVSRQDGSAEHIVQILQGVQLHSGNILVLVSDGEHVTEMSCPPCHGFGVLAALSTVLTARIRFDRFW
jgi:hypothetical protein